MKLRKDDPELKAKSWTEYELDVRLHIKPKRIGSKKLTDLKPRDLIQWQTELANYSPHVAAKARRGLSSALQEAVYLQLIPQNPLESVRPVKAKTPEASIWQPSQCAIFMDAAKDHKYYLAYYLILTLGLRLGELRGLQWKDIIFQSDIDYIKIDRQNRSEGSTPNFQEPKTKNSKRLIDIDKHLLCRLDEHKREQQAKKVHVYRYTDNDLIIATKYGSSPTPTRLREHFYKITKRAELPQIKLHELRHSAGSIWLERGMTLQQVSQRLGHSSVSITEKIYIHQISEKQKRIGLSLDEMLNGK